MSALQVTKHHYDFSTYISQSRWSSYWHQLHEIHQTKTSKILEFGPGPGILKRIAELSGLIIETADIDPDLQPTYVRSILDTDFADDAFETVCAFQVLEHLTYKDSLAAIRELVRISEKYLIISLPDARPLWNYEIYIPMIGPTTFSINRPQIRNPAHVFDGEHYWEINKRGYEEARVTRDFASICKIVRNYRVPGNPYHRIYVFNCQ